MPGMKRLLEAQDELSRVEAAIGHLMANERFPEHPGPYATDVEVRAWLSAHDMHTERLDTLVVRRGELLDDLRDRTTEQNL